MQNKKKYKVLFDTNIILDVFLNREPFSNDSAEVLRLCASDRITGFIAPHSFTNIFYLIRKTYDQKTCRMLLRSLMDFLDVSCLNSEKIKAALNRENFKDFEDCIQDECALDSGADFIITRNIKDFENSCVKAITPGDFLIKIM